VEQEYWYKIHGVTYPKTVLLIIQRRCPNTFQSIISGRDRQTTARGFILSGPPTMHQSSESTIHSLRRHSKQLSSHCFEVFNCVAFASILTVHSLQRHSKQLSSHCFEVFNCVAFASILTVHSLQRHSKQLSSHCFEVFNCVAFASILIINIFVQILLYDLVRIFHRTTPCCTAKPKNIYFPARL
jgi:hypothetical protein